MNSTYSIPKDTGLVSKIVEKLGPQTKTFVFPSGESTITLENRGLEEIREKLCYHLVLGVCGCGCFCVCVCMCEKEGGDEE